jgi:hypothetical protein
VFLPRSTTELRFFVREAERKYVFERAAAGPGVRIRIAGRSRGLLAKGVA